MKYIILVLLIVSSAFSQKTTLPHYMTAQEKARYQTYSPQPSKNVLAEAPPEQVRTMAEWEELQGLEITWTSYYEILAQIVDSAQEEVTVYIVCSDSDQVKLYLNQHGVPLHNIKYLEQAYDTIWCRDYGPWSAYETDVTKLDIIDWIYNRPRPNDDVIPAAMASYLNLDIYEATENPDDLVHTGGNFMVDGHGTGFASKLILDENSDKTEAEIDDIALRYLGLNRFVKMETLPYDEIHHIDMHMKLLDEETLLVGQYPEGVADGPQIEANLQYILDNYKTCFGRDYEVVRIPMPPDANGRYPDNNGEYRTYTNSVIVNGTIIVPTYEEQYDTTALRIYRETMPGYNVVGIDCNDIIGALGAIHCITKEIGVDEPVWISYAKKRHAYVTESSYEITAKIKSASGISGASAYWTTDTTAGFTALSMSAVGTDSFTVSIPQQAEGTEVFYYLSATSNSGRTVSKPLVAPKGAYSFTVEGTSGLVDASALLPNSILLPNYPNPFNPSTTISYQISGPQFVSLSIYNNLGQRVETLVSGTQSAGTHKRQWKATGFASGVYFCRLETEHGFTQIRKLILLK